MRLIFRAFNGMSYRIGDAGELEEIQREARTIAERRRQEGYDVSELVCNAQWEIQRPESGTGDTEGILSIEDDYALAREYGETPYHECRGCSNMVPIHQRYCEDCQ